MAAQCVYMLLFLQNEAVQSGGVLVCRYSLWFRKPVNSKYPYNRSQYTECAESPIASITSVFWVKPEGVYRGIIACSNWSHHRCGNKTSPKPGEGKTALSSERRQRKKMLSYHKLHHQIEVRLNTLFRLIHAVFFHSSLLCLFRVPYRPSVSYLTMNWVTYIFLF